MLKLKAHLEYFFTYLLVQFDNNLLIKVTVVIFKAAEYTRIVSFSLQLNIII